MPACYFVIPGDPAQITGGYIYDREVTDGLRRLGWTVHVVGLAGGFPMPDRTALLDADRALGQIPDGSLTLVDGLALGAMPGMVRKHGQRLIFVALVHHPLAEESGLNHDDRDRLRYDETAALAMVNHVICTSPATARQLIAHYGVARDAVTIAQPGTDPVPPARGAQEARLRALIVATVIPRKGHLLLIDAMDRLRHLEWDIWCVGSLDRAPDHVAAVRRKLKALKLEDRVHLVGEVTGADLRVAYDRADFFVLPTYHEGYGMALAEALSYGLPIVATTAGAIPDVVPAAAGLLVPAGELEPLIEALDRLITDGELRGFLAEGALAAGQKLPRWQDSVERVAKALHKAQAGATAAATTATSDKPA